MTSKMLRAFSLAEVGLVTSIAWAYSPIPKYYYVHSSVTLFIDCIGQLATWAGLSRSVIKVKAVCALAQGPWQQMIAHRPKCVYSQSAVELEAQPITNGLLLNKRNGVCRRGL